MNLDPVADFRAAILRDLGHAPADIEPERMHRFATNDRRGDLAGYARMFADRRGGVYGDHRSGAQFTWQAERQADETPEQLAERERQIAEAKRQRAVRQQLAYARAADNIARTWRECTPVDPGTAAALYLARRGFAALAPPRCLRWHPALPYFDAAGDCIGTWPAMVAPLVHAGERQIVALHRTYLTAAGAKAHGANSKKLTSAAGPVMGACIPLFRPDDDGAIGIAEGIETALGAYCASGLPTVAAYSAGALAAWRWPASVRRIVVFGDNDGGSGDDGSGAGQRAAEALAQRAAAAGVECEIVLPDVRAVDWADLWKATQP